MKRQEAHNENGGITSILDLPEHVLRNIFRHVSIEELFTTVRNVNPNIKKYIDDYLPLVGVFLLIRGKGLTTRSIHIFKPKGSNFVTISAIVQPFSVSDLSAYMRVEEENLDMFPVAFPSTEIQGALLFGLYSRSYISASENHIAEHSIAVDLYVFDVEMSHWKLLKTRDAKLNGRVMLCSAISDSTLLTFLRTSRKGKGYQTKLISISMDTVPNSFFRLFTGNDPRSIKMPEELHQLSEFSMLNLTNNSILLIGGSYFNDMAPSGENLFLNREIWHGTLVDGNSKIVWNAIDIGGSCMGHRPICFKLKDNVYITGERTHCTSGIPEFPGFPWKRFSPGLRCPSCIDIGNNFDRYDCKEKKLYLNAYSMPYALSKMYHPVKIATDKNETFAVLVLNNKPSCEERMSNGEKESCEEIMLIFTEEDGFVEVECFQALFQGTPVLLR